MAVGEASAAVASAAVQVGFALYFQDRVIRIAACYMVCHLCLS